MVNLLGIVAISALTLALILTWLKSDRVIRVELPRGGNSWVAREALISMTPKWEDRHSSPPLNLGEAIKASDGIVKELNNATKSLGIGNWMIDGITLSPLEMDFNGRNQRWIYLIRFNGVRLAGHSGPPHTFDAMLLMDGSIIAGQGNRNNEIDEIMAKIYP